MEVEPTGKAQSLEDFSPKVQELVRLLMILQTDKTPSGRVAIREVLEGVERRLPEMFAPLRKFFTESVGLQ